MTYVLHRSKSFMPFAVGVLSSEGHILRDTQDSIRTRRGWFNKTQVSTIIIWFEVDGEEIHLSGELAEQKLNAETISDEEFMLTRIFSQIFALDLNFMGYITGQPITWDLELGWIEHKTDDLGRRIS